MNVKGRDVHIKSWTSGDDVNWIHPHPPSSSRWSPVLRWLRAQFLPSILDIVVETGLCEDFLLLGQAHLVHFVSVQLDVSQEPSRSPNWTRTTPILDLFSLSLGEVRLQAQNSFPSIRVLADLTDCSTN